MLFQLASVQRPNLQARLDADRVSFSRRIQLETEGAFSAEEMKVFRMLGLFGEIPGTNCTKTFKIESGARKT